LLESRRVRLREIPIALGLVVLLLVEAASFRRWELRKRVLLLPKLAPLPIEAAESAGAMYEFDREFGRFLEGVRRLVPPGSSVAVSLPSTPMLYLYTAHYALEPRPVFDARVKSAADFLAVYAPSQAAGGAGAWTVPGGTVRPLR
jgi:hypothetical protein